MLRALKSNMKWIYKGYAIMIYKLFRELDRIYLTLIPG
jgi:hypothetical protein